MFRIYTYMFFKCTLHIELACVAVCIYMYVYLQVYTTRGKCTFCARWLPKSPEWFFTWLCGCIVSIFKGAFWLFGLAWLFAFLFIHKSECDIISGSELSLWLAYTYTHTEK